jgi:hypothetical protein
MTRCHRLRMITAARRVSVGERRRMRAMTTMVSRGISVLVPVVLVGLLAGCSNGLLGTRGEGAVKAESRQATAFTHIEVSSGVAVVVRIGPAEPYVVRAQENLLGLIATEVKGSTLHIHSTKSYTTTEVVEVSVVTPQLDGIAMSGGSHGQVYGLAAERLDLDLSGGTLITAAGSAESVALDAGGGSRAQLGDLAARNIRIDLSGGSTVTVRASNEVTGSASGDAKATILGGARINVSTTSGAHVSAE